VTCADKSAKGGALYHCSAWGDIQAGCTLLTGPSSRANIGPHSTELPERRAYRHQTRIPMGHRHVATVQVACSVLNAQGYRRKLAPNSQHHPPGRMTHTPFGPFLFFKPHSGRTSQDAAHAKCGMQVSKCSRSFTAKAHMNGATTKRNHLRACRTRRFNCPASRRRV